MIDDEQHDEQAPAPPTGAPAADADVLAAVEAAAAREASEEAAQDGAKVVKPKATTSRKAHPDPATPAGAAAPASLAIRRNGAVAGEVVEAPTAATVRDGSVAQVNATNVDVTRGGIGRVRAVDVAVSQGGIGFAQGDRISVEMGGIGAALAGELRVTQGGVGSVLARDVHVEQSVVRTVVANNVHFERTTGVLVLLARRVDGDVRAILDWRAAVAFGAAFGIVTSIFRRRR